MSEYGPLTLHVPEPEVRPGGTPDFSDVKIPKAGAVPRPEVDADPEAIRDLAYSIIRVLNDARMLIAQRLGKTSFPGTWAGRST